MLINFGKPLDADPGEYQQRLQQQNGVVPHSPITEAMPQAIAQETIAHQQNTTETRSRWEQNLINASLKALKENPENADKNLQTAQVGSKHLAVYSVEKQTLAILNPEQEVIFKVQRGERPSVDKLTDIQKNYWQNPGAYQSPNQAKKGANYAL